MTNLDELKAARGHLAEAQVSVAKALRGAVLSRSRLDQANAIDRQLSLMLDDVDGELMARGFDVFG